MSDTNIILTNKNASDDAKKLYEFLNEISGKYILSGQQETPRDQTNRDELEYVKKCSGHYPAILGLDYIENDFEGVNKRATDWYNQGGIVSICWHWGIPPYGVGYPSSQEEIDMDELFKEEGDMYKGMLDNMDVVAESLIELQEKGIPVLWRPFHEFDGQWFWWGKGGPEYFKKLWRLMYDRFTNVHGLNNLIWVLGYSGEKKDGWYPGDEYVDVIGGDAYSEGIHEDLYDFLKTVTDKKMPICHHENGPIPNPDEMAEKNIDWCWFLTWHTIHIHEQNTEEYIKFIYNNPRVLTLENIGEKYAEFTK